MATAKNKLTTKTTKRAKKAVPTQRSFVRAKEQSPFLTFRTTHQTAYWVIIGLLVLAIGTWVMTLTVQVQDLYNQIELANPGA